MSAGSTERSRDRGAAASGAAASGRHCVTCSDEAVPMRVRELREEGLAVCDEGIEVMTELVGPVEPGDELLVHAGVALSRVDA